MIQGVAPTLVLLHGFTHTGASWDPVIGALGERYRALAPDLRGHGSAGEAVPVTLEAVIADLAALTPGPFTLAGYSMGGRIALHVALALPDRVTRLLLIGASPGLADPAERARRRADDGRLAAEAERLSIAQFAERWARTPVLAGLPADAAARVAEDRLRSPTAGLAAALRGLGTGALPPVWERLGELSMPTVLIVGERDEKFGAIAAQMGERITGAGVAIIPGAGHAVHLEAPAAVARLIGGDETRAAFGPRGSGPERLR
jgi:2-succinyl-6-hydroxy-2,4-cyclohexadiene-1-carboxylate synthase